MNVEPKRQRGRPASGKGVPVNVRIQPRMLAAIDREVKALAKRTATGVATRADVIREAVATVLLGKGR